MLFPKDISELLHRSTHLDLRIILRYLRSDLNVLSHPGDGAKLYLGLLSFGGQLQQDLALPAEDGLFTLQALLLPPLHLLPHCLIICLQVYQV